MVDRHLLTFCGLTAPLGLGGEQDAGLQLLARIPALSSPGLGQALPAVSQRSKYISNEVVTFRKMFRGLPLLVDSEGEGGQVRVWWERQGGEPRKVSQELREPL